MSIRFNSASVHGLLFETRVERKTLQNRLGKSVHVRRFVRCHFGDISSARLAHDRTGAVTTAVDCGVVRRRNVQKEEGQTPKSHRTFA